MAKNKDQRKEDSLSEVENALTKSEQFIEDNQKILSIVVGAIVIVVAGYLSFTKLYIQPKEETAQSQMFMAENYFAKDSFNLAINGDGNYLGFIDIIDEYSVTKSANLAKYYTGISYLHLGEYDEAINYLNDFETEDLLLAPIKIGSIGDAYMELGEADKALSNYKKAYGYDNELTAPIYMMKAAKYLESEGDLNGALELYNTIKNEYPDSSEGSTIEKYIARVETTLSK